MVGFGGRERELKHRHAFIEPGIAISLCSFEYGRVSRQVEFGNAPSTLDFSVWFLSQRD